MDGRSLREHQEEAVAAAVKALELPAGVALPPAGLRTQVIMATGSGKTDVAVATARELAADRVLVLVPSLDLLTQTAVGWKVGGRSGPVVGVSSLRQVGFPNTTDAAELVTLTRESGTMTVFATYASLGTIAHAHTAGLPAWDLIVVDEAHRTSGRLGKPWGVVHDNGRVPATARLYMTATPRLWQADSAGDDTQEQSGGAPGELAASMEDDPDGIFGAVAYRLPLEEAQDRGIVAPYQVVCVEVADPMLQSAMLTAAEEGEVRGARLAALQTTAMKTAVEEELTRVLTFHQRVAEAEAFAQGMPGTAAALWQADPQTYPRPEAVRADWLCGEHKPVYRRSVLGDFGAGRGRDGAPVEKWFLSSVKVLGEGVDTRECDAVLFCDVRGSMPDLVQAVGRALRMHPGEGKVASLVVPVFLGPGESPDDMLTSPAYHGLAKLLTALRAHDSRIVEALSEPKSTSTPAPAIVRDDEAGEGDCGDSADGADGEPVSRPARELLKFSSPRDAGQLAAFIRLRVLSPERVYWRRGIQAAARYAQEFTDLQVPYNFRTPGDWSPAEFPLGVWLADCRRYYSVGSLEEGRVAQLEKLGMVWSTMDAAFEEGLAAAAGWAAEHRVGLAAPVDAVFQGYPVGTWLRNQRAAARRSPEPGDDQPQVSAAALSDERRQALEAIDPGWCPDWAVDWQRCFRLAWAHLQEEGTLPAGTVDGEALGTWIAAQRKGFTKLAATQQWLLTSVLGIEPAAPKRTRAGAWAQNLAAARQFVEREQHLEVPRSHREVVEGVETRLGVWVNNQRSRAATLSPEQVKQLSEIGMRWS
ncbi:Helicase associated domain protein [Streptomyces sp. NPDC021100]|uniref:DEAD/DEAH box helicase n=1 Tax=Streptomyces sp. NPDC021100 TaxID=3365114 RepID=UPI0037A60BB1